MPFNLTSGSTAQFDVAFFTSSGALTVPTSATLVVSYVTSSGFSTSETVTLSVSGSVFSGTWGSGPARLGIATYSITAPGQPSATTGQLRIIGG